MYLSPFKRAALRTANKVRTSQGLDPKKKLEPGYQEAGSSCPIANTINDNLRPSVNNKFIIIFNPKKEGHFTLYKIAPFSFTWMFIKLFDLGLAARRLRLKKGIPLGRYSHF